MKRYQVLVVGGGNAGISVAAQLLLKDKTLKVGIIEPSEKHYYQPAYTLVGAGEFDLQKTVRSQESCMPKGSDWIKKSVQSFDPDKNTVLCTDGDSYAYDVLLVAPGLELNWEGITGLSQTLGKNQVTSNYSFDSANYTWELIRNFKGGRAVFTNPNTPIKCGGAPHKIMYLACDYWRKNGVLKNTEVHYINGGAVLFGVKEYLLTLEQVVKKYGIHLHNKSNTVKIDGTTHTLEYEEILPEGGVEKRAITFDFAHVVPPQRAPQIVRESVLADPNNPYGYLEVDPNTLQHKRYPNVFGCGDVINAPCSKTGAAIRKQAPVVVNNILNFLTGKSQSAKYDGYAACPIPTEYGKLMLAEFDYSNKPKMSFPFDQAKPRWSMWILKKYILPWLYWNKILTGKA